MTFLRSSRRCGDCSSTRISRRRRLDHTGAVDRFPSADDRAIVDDLYRAFARYERPATFRGCPCGGCWGQPDPAEPDVEEVAVPSPGGSRSLRSLTEDELENFVATVPGTSGDLDLFKHYLPRLLEIVADGGFESDWAGADRVVAVLEHPDQDGAPQWAGWPHAEARAVSAYLDRFITDAWRAEWEDTD